MKICILHSKEDKPKSHYSNFEQYFENINLDDIKDYCDISNFIFENHYIDKKCSFQQIKELIEKNFDIFINLCDGAKDEERAGEDVIDALEYFSQRYTGANKQFYEPSRQKQKDIAIKNGINVPKSLFVYVLEDLKNLKDFNYPLIVKHYNSYCSIGLTLSSKCNNLKEVYEQCEIMLKNYGGVLIEEFIEGREFVVLICETPQSSLEECVLVFNPLEYIFEGNDTFRYFDQKYFSEKKINLNFEKELSDELMDMTKKIFIGLGGRGYARTDIRVDRNNKPYLLEINPNCSVFTYDKKGSSDLILLNSIFCEKSGHSIFIENIIKTTFLHS